MGCCFSARCFDSETPQAGAGSPSRGSKYGKAVVESHEKTGAQNGDHTEKAGPVVVTRRSSDDGDGKQVVKPITTADKVAKTLNDTVSLVKLCRPLAMHIPFLNEVLRAILNSTGVVQGTATTDKELESFRTRFLTFFYEVIEPKMQVDPFPQQLKTQFEHMIQDLRIVYQNCGRIDSTGKICKTIEGESVAGMIKSLDNTFNEALMQLQANGIAASYLIPKQARLILEQKALLKSLPVVPAQYNSERRAGLSGCEEGEHDGLLRDIHAWSEDSTEPGIFWLLGSNLSTKSKIAHSVAVNLKTRLGGSFFFSRDDNDRSDPWKVFTTIAHDLAHLQPSFGAEIAAHLAKDPKLGSKAPEVQVKRLIMEPLGKINNPTSNPIVIVLDAIDECRDIDLMMDALNALVVNLDKLKFSLKLFITSAQEDDVASRILPMGSSSSASALISNSRVSIFFESPPVVRVQVEGQEEQARKVLADTTNTKEKPLPPIILDEDISGEQVAKEGADMAGEKSNDAAGVGAVKSTELGDRQASPVAQLKDDASRITSAPSSNPSPISRTPSSKKNSSTERQARGQENSIGKGSASGTKSVESGDRRTSPATQSKGVYQRTTPASSTTSLVSRNDPSSTERSSRGRGGPVIGKVPDTTTATDRVRPVKAGDRQASPVSQTRNRIQKINSSSSSTLATISRKDFVPTQEHA